MPPKKTQRPAQENISLGPQVREGKSEANQTSDPRRRFWRCPHSRALRSANKIRPAMNLGELVFGVARIFASFNDTFVHVTDLR